MAGEGIDPGIRFSLTNVASTHLNYPLYRVNRAVLNALKRLDVYISEENELIEGREIIGDTDLFDVRVEMKNVVTRRMKSNLTSLTVDAKFKKYVVERSKKFEATVIRLAQEFLRENLSREDSPLIKKIPRFRSIKRSGIMD